MKSWSASRRYGLSLLCLSIAVLAPHDSHAQEGQHVEVQVDQGGFHPTEKQSLTVSTNDVTATVVSGSPFIVTATIRGEARQIKLPTDLLQVTAIRLFRPNRLVIAGQVNGDVDIVTVVDLAAGKVEDFFLCYTPAISPDGSYVAFVKFYPAHGISSAEDHYMLYDLSLSAAANRPSGSKAGPSTVGRVIYPEGVGNVEGDNVDIDDRPLHRMASETFFWNPHSDSMAFLDSVEDRYTLISVCTRPMPVAVWQAPIPASLICKGSSQPCSRRLVGVEYPAQAGQPVELRWRDADGSGSGTFKAELDDMNTDRMRVVQGKQ